ncbi:MAG: protein kinase [Vicinamibacterales bacterium]
MIGETISHYRVLSRLGAGGMGVVYEAEDTRLGRKVAIKFLPDEANADAEAVQRFLREARVISSLNHPHICTLYDIGQHADRQFMVMELLDGQSLKDRIAKGAMPFEDVLELGAQMADALDAAHAQGIVHRDIKPANLFITRRGTLKVLDFGVAKLSKAGRDHDHLDATIGATDQLTTIGTTIGTVSYMSPEQARGHEIDARSDVFSAGVVLYEMATGRLPFPGSTVATIFEGLLTKKAMPPSAIQAGLSPEFDRIIDKALEKDRETRYQGAAELRADLKRLKRAADSGATAIASATVVAAAAAHPAPVDLPASTVSAAALADAEASAKVISPTTPPVAPAGHAWRKPFMVGAPIVMAALVGGFWFYRSVTTPALTEKDTVVLSSVVNRTGDVMFDDTLGEALALQLRQSPFLTVVADQQVQSTLRLMGRDPSEPITAEIGRDVCQRAGGKALLGGTIAMLGSAYVVTLNAQDCVDGNVIAEEQVQADSKETVLAALGTAVSVFREKLGESLGSIQRYDAKIEEASTPSLEALKAYSQGLRTRRTSGDFDSVPFFRRAIELDPEFALAYARLGTVYANLGQGDEARKMTAKAYEFRAKVSEVERLYIEARYYTTVEVDIQKAIEAYQVWLAAYPNDYTALANSALLLRQRGDAAEALRNQEAATRVAPEEPIAWRNLGDTYLNMGRFADARKALETALALQNNAGGRASLFALATLTGDQPLADAQATAVAGSRDEIDFMTVQMRAAAFTGKMQQVADLAGVWQSRMETASRRNQVGQIIANIAINEALVGLSDRANARIQSALADELLQENAIDERMVVAAINRDGRTARALLPQALAELRRQSAGNPAIGTIERAYRALLALAEGRPSDAVPLLEPLTFTPENADAIGMWAIAKIQLEDWPAAIKGLTSLTEDTWQRGLGTTKAFAMVHLARAHVAMGNPAEARKAYQAFFDFWKAADPDVPLLVQAREEFSKLGS